MLSHLSDVRRINPNNCYARWPNCFIASAFSSSFSQWRFYCRLDQCGLSWATQREGTYKCYDSGQEGCEK
jgi:hypothetical protein